MKLNLFGIPLFFILFAFVGTIFGLVSIGMQWHDFKIIQTGIKTTGIVSDYRISSDGNRAPVVKFQGPDSLLTYFSATYSSPPAYKIGEKVKIWYTPDHPENVVMSGFERWFMPIFFAVFFLIFGGIGYGGILFNYVRNREQKRLLLSGTAVQATVFETFFNRAITVNDRNPWIIRCKWVDPRTKQSHTFDSENLWKDPNPNCKIGSTITVYIEPDNPSRYHVDVSFLKNAL